MDLLNWSDAATRTGGRQGLHATTPYEAVTDTAVTALRNDVDVFLDTLEQHSEMAIDFVAGMASSLITRYAELREETASAVGGVNRS